MHVSNIYILNVYNLNLYIIYIKTLLAIILIQKSENVNIETEIFFIKKVKKLTLSKKYSTIGVWNELK